MTIPSAAPPTLAAIEQAVSDRLAWASAALRELIATDSVAPHERACQERLGYTPPGRLIIESVVGEEPDGNGTLALCAGGWLADAAVVLEPTSNRVAYGHRGIIGVRLTVQGRPGHAAVQSSEANAILAAGRLAQALDSALAAAHGVDEYLPLDQWATSTRALAAFIVRWCG